MTKEEFIEKSKLILTDVFVKGGSTENVFESIYDKLVLPQANVIKSVCEQHDWKYSNDGEVKYCSKCDTREWA